MKNDMKLIMESWRDNILSESDEASFGGKLEDSLEDVFDDVLLGVAKELESKDEKELNEVVITGTLLLSIWTGLLGAAGLASLLAKFMKVWRKAAEDDRGHNRYEKVEKFLEGAVQGIATFGTKPSVKFLVRMYKARKGEDATDLEQKIDTLYTIATVIVCLAVAGFEIASLAKESGGIAGYASDLVSKVGFPDSDGLQAAVELFEKTISAGSDSFDVASYVKKAGQAVADILRPAGGGIPLG